MSTPDLSVTEGSQGLEVENLRKSYKTRVVIRDFSMSLNRGKLWRCWVQTAAVSRPPSIPSPASFTPKAVT